MGMTVKTAISLPRPVFRQIEAIRRRTHWSRSQILLEAFQMWLNGQRDKELERRYAEGYRRHPESKAEMEAWLKASLSSWDKESW